RAQHALEHVEAGAPIGVENLGMDLAVCGVTDRPAIAQRIGALLARTQIHLHRAFFAAVIDAVIHASSASWRNARPSFNRTPDPARRASSCSGPAPPIYATASDRPSAP